MGRTITIVAIAALLTVVLWRIVEQKRGRESITYSELRASYLGSDPATTNKVEKITVIDDRLEVLVSNPEDGRPARKEVGIGSLEISPETVDAWIARGIAVEFRSAQSTWKTALSALPYIAILLVVALLFRQGQGGSQGGLFSFGKSRAKEVDHDLPAITLTEVAGVEEAKEELREIVEFLKEPDKFQRLGGKIPRGVLLVGPPGTGKTHLARAVAGEAVVPFFSMSGSDFVEMFVGVGASRVRDLFEKAKQRAPCIIFVDEIDAVGRHRGAGLGGGHDEREQTLNQLLVEMDGFGSSASTVILIAATNRPDVLDPALLRPGRFDRHVTIDMPDARGREGILAIHTSDIPMASGVDLGELARGTPGLSGADLKNMVNEAALLAARQSRSDIGMGEFERAKEKIMWGMERRSLVMSDRERRLTAAHEAGHALVAALMPGADPVHKCTIVPRGRALGLTSYLPDDERHTVSREWCIAKLVSILGGRAAEQIVFGDMTSGAANDLQAASELARRMVCEWGMSDKLGPIAVGRNDEEIFIGRDLVHSRTLSERTLNVVDDEIYRTVTEALERARSLLAERRDALRQLSEALLALEALDRHQIDDIIQRSTPADDGAHEGPTDEPTEDSRPIVVERGIEKRDEAADGGRDSRSGRRRGGGRGGARRSGSRVDSSAESEKAGRDDDASLKAQTPVAREKVVPQAPPPAEETAASDRAEADVAADAVPSVDELPPVEPEPTPTPEPESTPEPETAQEPEPAPRPMSRPPPKPEPEAAPRAKYGRKTKTVRISSLPSSQVPASGADVTVVGTPTYGRAAKPTDDARPTTSAPEPVAPETKDASPATEPTAEVEQSDDDEKPDGDEHVADGTDEMQTDPTNGEPATSPATEPTAEAEQSDDEKSDGDEHTTDGTDGAQPDPTDSERNARV